MELQMAILCDAATDYGGRLSVLGTLDTIHTPQLPMIYPQCSIALRLIFSKVEEGLHKVRMNFVNEDGKPLVQHFQNIEIPVDVKLPDDSIFASRNVIVNIHQIKFDNSGHYSVDIALDGRQLVSIPLVVKQVNAPHSGAPGFGV
jgi:hypothetical protein